MGTPFAVDHKKAGYLISILVPFGWIFILDPLKKIRVGFLLILGLGGLNIITSLISNLFFGTTEQGLAYDLGLFVLGFGILMIGMVVNFWGIWHFYSKWVEEWTSTENKDEEIKTLKDKVESLDKDKDEVKES